MSRACVISLVAVFALVLACGRATQQTAKDQPLAATGHAVGSTSNLANGPSAAGPSKGCGVSGKQTGDFHLTATDGAGHQRDYELRVPSSYDATRPVPLSFVFHGAGGDEAQAKSFGLQDVPGAQNAIFIFPQGVPFQSYGVGWNDACGGYDMALFDQILASVEANYCVDTSHVVAAGFSWGCDFVTALACCRGDGLRAIIAASCSDDFSNSSDYRSYLDYPCPAKRSPAIRFTHATNADSGYAAPFFATTSALYRSLDGCSSSSTAVDPSPCQSFSGCSRPFVECAYDGLGHTRPAGWAADSWAFLSSLP